MDVSYICVTFCNFTALNKKCDMKYNAAREEDYTNLYAHLQNERRRETGHWHVHDEFKHDRWEIPQDDF